MTIGFAEGEKGESWRSASIPVGLGLLGGYFMEGPARGRRACMGFFFGPAFQDLRLRKVREFGYVVVSISG